MHRYRIGRIGLAAVLALSIVSCGGASTPGTSERAGSTSTSPSSGTVSLDKSSYPVFPNADAGAEPSVPAEQGGKGFTGDGWETNSDFDLLGDARAVKGGVFRDDLLEFPGTLRIYGPEITILNYHLNLMVYETLLGLHPTTLQFIPSLATHWQISPDKMEYRFRLNPNARFSDGTPVTSEDVVASWVFAMDKGLQELQIQTMLDQFEKPIAETKYIVRVRTKQLKWQNFLNFTQYLTIFPAHALKGLDGARYLKEYNFKLLPGSGPYIVRDADVIKGKSVSVRRRNDHWAAKHRSSVGVGNFDEIRWTVVRDQRLQLEMLKRGDADLYYVNISREWVEDFNFDKIQRGVILKRKIYTDAPSNIQGIAFNLRREPFNDVRVRKALQLLLNRELLIQKLFYNEYTPMNSYFPGGVYENPNNPENAYDPQQALKLLSEAGFNGRDAQGRLVRNGKPLTIEYMYADKGAERWLTIYQDDLRKVGITLNLRLLSYETLIQLRYEWRFELASFGWVPGTFPDPEALYRSDLADRKNSLNYTGVKDNKVDEILAAYNKEFDQSKRVVLLRELDGILANMYPSILEWEASFTRIAYLNKFGHPEGYFTRIGDLYYDVYRYWWIDPEKERRYREAETDQSVKLPAGSTEVRYWEEYGKRGGGAFEPPK
jgi:microcin C transport system substrate-binding protein